MILCRQLDDSGDRCVEPAVSDDAAIALCPTHLGHAVRLALELPIGSATKEGSK